MNSEKMVSINVLFCRCKSKLFFRFKQAWPDISAWFIATRGQHGDKTNEEVRRLSLGEERFLKVRSAFRWVRRFGGEKVRGTGVRRYEICIICDNRQQNYSRAPVPSKKTYPEEGYDRVYKSRVKRRRYSTGVMPTTSWTRRCRVRMLRNPLSSATAAMVYMGFSRNMRSAVSTRRLSM